MAQPLPFTAIAKAFSVSATATASTSVALPAAGNTIRVVNEGPNVAFVSIGVGTQTATLPTGTGTLTCIPVLASTDITLSIPNDQIYNISAICRSAGTAALTIQVGEGL